MTVYEANKILAKFGLGENAIGEAIASGPDGRRGKVDLLRGREFIGKYEACGTRRIFRVNADWADKEEMHHAECKIQWRWDGAPRCGRGYKWEDA